MDILGQDQATPIAINRWRNSAEADVLNSLKSQINTVMSKLAAERAIYKEATENYTYCVNERADKLFGLFNCKANTGGVYTQTQWKARAAVAKREVSRLEGELASLQSDLAKAIKLASDAAKAGVDLSEEEIMESLSSQEEAKSYGVWIAVGLVAIAGGFLVYKKIIKK